MDRERNFSNEKGWMLLSRFFPGGVMLRDFRRPSAAPAHPASGLQAEGARRLHGAHERRRRPPRWDAGDRAGCGSMTRVKQLTLELGATIFMGADPGAEARRVNRAFVAELAAAVAVVRTPLPGNRTWRGLRGARLPARLVAAAHPRNAAPAKATTLLSQLCRARIEDGEDEGPALHRRRDRRTPQLPADGGPTTPPPAA